LKKVGAISGFIKKFQWLSCDFGIFLGFLRIVFYRKSHGSGLWIMGPRLALSPWWTRDHAAARPLRGSGGRRDSSELREREREEVVRALTNGTAWRWSCGDGHTTALNRGGRWCTDGEIVPDVRRRDWSRGGCGG
jgi:hypothetical protein